MPNFGTINEKPKPVIMPNFGTIRSKRIGILSGIGPVAGAYLLTKLFEECQRHGCRLDEDFPFVLLASLNPSGTSEVGVVNEELVKEALAEGLRLLGTTRLDSIVIACNTVHKYFDWLQSRSPARLVNMVACAQRAAGPNPGVLCSRTSRDSNLYQGIMPTEAEQDVVDEVIWQVMSGTKDYGNLVLLESIVHNLRARGANKVIVGCTELSLVVREAPYIVDAGIEALKDALWN